MIFPEIHRLPAQRLCAIPPAIEPGTTGHLDLVTLRARPYRTADATVPEAALGNDMIGSAATYRR